MDRKEFLKIIGFSLTSYVIAQNFVGCDSSNSTQPTNVDFTIDLGDPNFSVLKTTGGSLIYNNVLIFRTNNALLKAVASKCTHEQATLEYSSTDEKIICPRHNSEFSTDGKVLKGPAKKNLVVYNVSENGNTVRIFS
ncbi:MAG: ubiquinol-cytochrome c reductase iron-sulfur subunit [Candidatus Kapaibacteriota bacterium]